MADSGQVEGNRATLIERIGALAPGLIAPDTASPTPQLRWLLGKLEEQDAAYRDAGFVDEAE